MTREEVAEIMTKPKSVSRLPQYRQIYYMARGTTFKGCLCGNGFDNLFNVCLSYYAHNKDEIIITEE